MSKSKRNAGFCESELKTPLNEILHVAEIRAEDIDEMAAHIKKTEKAKGFFGQFTKSQAIWQAQEYIQCLNDNLVKISLSLSNDYTRDEEIFQRLNSVWQSFDNANQTFLNVLKGTDYTDDGRSSFQLTILRNVIDCYEPDKRPRCSVVPIHDGIDLSH